MRRNWRPGRTSGSRTPGSAGVPVEVVFGGRHPSPRTVDLCLDAARSLRPHSGPVERCDVLVTGPAAKTEIRVDVRTAEGEVHVDRFVPVPDERALRARLREAFVEVADALEEVLGARGRRAGAADEEEPPPSIWHG